MKKALNSEELPHDFRGIITQCKIKECKFNVLYTKKGCLRSGSFQDSFQYDLILDGKFKITTLEKGKDVVKEYSKNKLIVIPPNVPHLFEALENTIMLEWWEKDIQAKYYEPYRKKVEEQFKKINKK